ncbi:hypothetical protein [Pseudanabaena mucicola]|uniref:hypothetical protein n=1 Tax=Pseudanabaena mucicola TaxID=71190 RepID=UPI002577747C|nr:hypothetical protein [Pseudanabaena mucicola]
MKKLIAMSALLGAASIGLLSATPSSAQTVIPIIGGTLGLNIIPDEPIAAFPKSFLNSTVLTPLGAVNISAFNGTISAVTAVPDFLVPGSGSFNVTASTIIYDSGLPVFFNGTCFCFPTPTTFVFTGTTTAGTNTNTPTTINATFSTTQFVDPTPIQVQVPITDGSIALLNDSTLASSNISKPEFQQEYRNDFNSSSFVGGRVLGLEDK